MLNTAAVAYQVVLTKADKIKESALAELIGDTMAIVCQGAGRVSRLDRDLVRAGYWVSPSCAPPLPAPRTHRSGPRRSRVQPLPPPPNIATRPRPASNIVSPNLASTPPTSAAIAHPDQRLALRTTLA